LLGLMVEMNRSRGRRLVQYPAEAHLGSSRRIACRRAPFACL
jgi:hypothetical protein